MNLSTQQQLGPKNKALRVVPLGYEQRVHMLAIGARKVVRDQPAPPTLEERSSTNLCSYLRKRNDLDVKGIIVLRLQERRSMPLATVGIVDELMRKWPSAISVFLKYEMKCVGCPIGPFHTIEDACREHSVDCAAFIADLRRAIDAEIPPGSRERRQSLGELARR